MRSFIIKLASSHILESPDIYISMSRYWNGPYTKIAFETKLSVNFSLSTLTPHGRITTRGLWMLVSNSPTLMVIGIKTSVCWTLTVCWLIWKRPTGAFIFLHACAHNLPVVILRKNNGLKLPI